MAIVLHEDFDTGLLEVKVSEKLSKEDYEHFEPAVERLIESCGKIKILLEMHDFHGWEMGAVWEDIKFATKHCRDIEKIAMVGETKWEKWMSAICKPFTMSTIKYFDAGQDQEARQWLA
ncbi:STAS/SEC14 domain-containing protein [Rosistilla oblonga]|uniref:STAS/SEC14 domain-containing protein n=1 Tax=Rosistilla oblonga TaxID=2527990 RepID=UPI003A970186